MEVRTYTSMASRWWTILRGKSYYHVPQPIGQRFRRDEIAGYYNDMTWKAEWPGRTDENGVPIEKGRDGQDMRHPITISQMALGVHDVWLSGQEEEDRDRFLRLAKWFEKNQDTSGGWPNPWTYVGEPSLGQYSAMAQGEAISVLVRAWKITGAETFLDAARRAFDLLRIPVREGGCAVISADDVFLEEYPEDPRNGVLNGWIFAAFGVYDLSLATGAPEVRSILSATVATLARSLDDYDMGYWSWYDVRGHVASPFYHELHSSLLDAMYVLTDVEVFNDVSLRWRRYGKNRINRGRAMTRKIWQKIREPVHEPTG